MSKIILNLFNTSHKKQLKKLKTETLIQLAHNLEIPIQSSDTIKSGPYKGQYKQLTNDEIKEIILLNDSRLVPFFKELKIPIVLEVKDLISNNVSPSDKYLVEYIYLPLKTFIDSNDTLKSKFMNECTLKLINGTVKSTNCLPRQIQGVYILSICINEIDYIVKLGSFAETQGMSGRISSFSGGCYDTGSATNKWFQNFIKRALEEGHTSKFTYYEYTEPVSVKIKELLTNGTTEIDAYVMRKAETDLFNWYSKVNNGIPPIFGSNCSTKNFQ